MGAADTFIRFYRCLDERDYDTMAALMLPDGTWHRQGAELRGGEQVRAAMQRRSPTMRIHHLLTNVFTESDEPGRASVTGYMLVVRHEPNQVLDGPAPLSGIENIRTVRGRLRETGEGWRIEHLGGDPPSFAAA